MMADILHAGRYAGFVYPAYVVSALTLAVLVGQTLWAARAAKRKALGDAE